MEDQVTIYIVSGGVGTSGEQVVNTVLAQFPDQNVRVITLGNVHFSDQIDEILRRAKTDHALVVHTLVDRALRAHMLAQAAVEQVTDIDLMGPMLTELAAALGQEPFGQPGLYRQLNKAYFDRVAAIEYTMAHDDGKNAPTWDQAEIVLVGVSRVGKTPLSLYLSVLGWKAANIPLIPGIDPHPNLFKLDPRRVVGLTIEAGQILAFRQERQRRLGTPGGSTYTDPESVVNELQYARQICRRGGFKILDVTDKPIETSADEIIRLITTRFGLRDRRS